jgi:hypothetical protein
VPRALVADGEPAVAAADPAPLARARDAQRLRREPARRRRSAAARRRAARLGRRGDARSGAPRAARFRCRGSGGTADPRFRYASTHGSATRARAASPSARRCGLTVDFSLNLSTPYDVQKLRRAIEPVRDRGSAPSSLARDAAPQAPSVNVPPAARAGAPARSTRSPRSISTARRACPAGARRQRLAAAHPRADHRAAARRFGVRRLGDRHLPSARRVLATRARAGAEELERAKAAEKAYWRLFWLQPEIVEAVLTPVQRELNTFVKQMVAVPKKQREQSQWSFQYPSRCPSRAAAAAPRVRSRPVRVATMRGASAELTRAPRRAYARPCQESPSRRRCR